MRASQARPIDGLASSVSRGSTVDDSLTYRSRTRGTGRSQPHCRHATTDRHSPRRTRRSMLLGDCNERTPRHAKGAHVRVPPRERSERHLTLRRLQPLWPGHPGPTARSPLKLRRSGTSMPRHRRPPGGNASRTRSYTTSTHVVPWPYWRSMRRVLALAVVLASLLTACVSGDDAGGPVGGVWDYGAWDETQWQ